MSLWSTPAVMSNREYDCLKLTKSLNRCTQRAGIPLHDLERQNFHKDLKAEM